MEMRSEYAAADTITELEHKMTMTENEKKNHLQIFSQQHSTVNGQYAFLLLLPLPLLPFYFPTFFANARFPFIMRIQFFSKAYELISTFLPLAYGIVQRDLFINKNQSTAVQTILLIWCNCSVHLNSILWSNPKVRCYRGFLCVRTCLPMDIIIYANVQILHNVEHSSSSNKNGKSKIGTTTVNAFLKHVPLWLR